MKKIIVLLLMSITLLGYEGKFEGNFFIEKLGRFSIEVDKPFRFIVTDGNEKDYSFANFQDNLGNFVQFQVAFSSDYKNDNKTLRAFQHATLLNVMKIKPGTKILHEEWDKEGKLLFNILHMPKSSSLIDEKTGIPLDSTRGYLFYFLKDIWITISYEFSPTEIEMQKSRGLSDKNIYSTCIEKLKNQIKKIHFGQAPFKIATSQETKPQNIGFDGNIDEKGFFEEKEGHYHFKIGKTYLFNKKSHAARIASFASFGDKMGNLIIINYLEDKSFKKDEITILKYKDTLIKSFKNPYLKILKETWIGAGEEKKLFLLIDMPKKNNAIESSTKDSLSGYLIKSEEGKIILLSNQIAPLILELWLNSKYSTEKLNEEFIKDILIHYNNFELTPAK